MSGKANALNAFQKVAKSVPIRSANLRHPSGAKIKPSGMVLCNTEASGEILATSDELAKNLNKTGIEWFVNLANKEVAGQLVSMNTPGVTPIRKAASGTFTVYMHNVFAEYPSLRPSSRINVPVTVHNDPDGTYIMFQLNMALTTGRGARKVAAAGESVRATDPDASTR